MTFSCNNPCCWCHQIEEMERMFEEGPKEKIVAVHLPDYAEQRIENTIRYFFTYHKNRELNDFKTLAELIIKDLLL